jgi:hypothetical protein
MTNTEFAGMVSGGRFRGILTLVLAVALLLCHGALGAHHQAHQTSTGDLERASGHASHESTTGAHMVWEPEGTLKGTRAIAQAA